MMVFVFFWLFYRIRSKLFAKFDCDRVLIRGFVFVEDL